MITPDELALRIVAHMKQNNMIVHDTPGHLNIVYLEGVSTDLTLNDNAIDVWNDLSLLIDHTSEGVPRIVFSAAATTDPGRASTISTHAARLGGVARITLGQHFAWRMGYHRFARSQRQHPALVQCSTVLAHRDANKDGKRLGDAISKAYGINQHSTNPHYKDGLVGFHSAGCLVRKLWADHLQFIKMLAKDPRQRNTKFVWGTTILEGASILLPQNVAIL